MYLFAHRPGSKSARQETMDAFPAKLDVLRFPVNSNGPAIVFYCGDQGGCNPTVGIKNVVIFAGKSQNASFNKFYRELTGVDGFLGVIAFHVWNFPDKPIPLLFQKHPKIRGILSKRIPGRLTLVWPFVVCLSGVLGGNADGVKIEKVLVALGEPQKGFVASGKSARGMKPVVEVPDNTVSQAKTFVFEDGIEKNIKRKNFTLVYVVSHLPAETAPGGKETNQLPYDRPLSVQVFFYCASAFIFFPEVIRR